MTTTPNGRGMRDGVVLYISQRVRYKKDVREHAPLGWRNLYIKKTGQSRIWYLPNGRRLRDEALLYKPEEGPCVA